MKKKKVISMALVIELFTFVVGWISTQPFPDVSLMDFVIEMNVAYVGVFLLFYTIARILHWGGWFE